MDWNLTYKKKEWEGLLYENGTGKKVVRHSKLKLWTFSKVMVNMNDL